MSRMIRAAAIVPVVAGVLSLQAAPIPGLFNTGVDDNGALLPLGEVDPHYKLIESADPAYPGPDVLVPSGAPIPPWVGDRAGSRWISPANGTSILPGNYIYQTTFVLTGFDISTAVINGEWSVDDNGVEVRLNGEPTGVFNNSGFGGMAAFSITTGFIEGTNTLEFVVSNGGADANPHGVRIEMTGNVLAPGTAPIVKVQPLPRIAPIGDSVSFSVTAEGTAPLTYEWRRNGVNLEGASEPTLDIPDLTKALAGKYDVVVKNAFGSATSAPVALTVRDRLTGFFDTGVDANKLPIADGDIDPHYKLVTSADSASQDAIAADSSVFPIVAGPWVANSDVSKWIGPRFDTTEAASGVYVYRITFDLTGFDPASAVLLGNWAADNDGASTEILLNGLGCY